MALDSTQNIHKVLKEVQKTNKKKFLKTFRLLHKSEHVFFFNFEII